jgi:serine/threonine-protein kinase
MADIIAALTAALADRYRIERELGAGGMATVYLAQDLKHDRQVAIKVLRPELAAVIGADRFLAEIKTTAHLQHPHILPLFDSGVAEGFLYYVMPVVEGESLRDRLEREKQLPIPDAVRIAIEVAGALDYAHRHGVIHRDIKPENILLHDGRALVGDFGIALAASKAGSTRMTETGMSLGTPQYMSPEQAMGEREITARSDVYALGCVVYEMLCGEPPFGGPTAQAIVAKVLTEEPPRLLPRRHTIPPNVEAAVLIALEKLPADRFATPAEFATALQDGQTTSRHDGRTVARRATVPPSRRLAAWFPWLVGPLLLMLGWWAGTSRYRAALPPIEGFGRSTKVTWEPGLEISPALSPDGKYVAYAAGNPATTRIFVRQVTGGRPIPLTSGQDETQSEPTWSPDGARVLYRTRTGIFSAPATGGTPHTEFLSRHGSEIGSAAWAPDGVRIAFTMGDSLFITTPGTAPTILARLSGPDECRWSPRATFVACTLGNPGATTAGVTFGNISSSRIVVIRVADGTTHIVSDTLTSNSSPAWSSDERWVYYVSTVNGARDVYAIRLATDGGALGRPRRLTTGLGAQTISVAPDGRRLAYNAMTATTNIASLPGPRPLTRGQQNVDLFRYSRDGRWILYASDISGINELYRMQATGGEAEQLTSGSTADNFAPDLSPDGKEIAFHSLRTGTRDIFVLPLDGGPIQQVTFTAAQEMIPRWSPDGRALIYATFSTQGGIWTVGRDSAGGWSAPRQLSATGAFPDWSPDGRTIVFGASVFGTGGLLVMPSSGGPARQILATGGEIRTVEFPKFSEDGRTIDFKSHDREGHINFWSVPLSGGFPRRLARIDDVLSASAPYWDMWRGRIAYVRSEVQSDIIVMETLPQGMDAR